MSNEFLALILFSIYLLHFPLSFSVCVVLELYHSFNRTIHLPPSLFYTHSASPFFLTPSVPPPAPEGVHSGAQAPHRQAAEDRPPAGRSESPGGGHGEAALQRR